MPDSLHRTFIAFSFEEYSVEGLVRLQRQLKPRLKAVHWVLPEQFHITVSFLGEIPITEVTKAVVAIKPIIDAFQPITLKVTGINGFPSDANARIIYAQLGGAQLEYFLQYVAKIRKTLQEQGIEFNNKPFIPHVTIGRAKMKQNLRKYKELQTPKLVLHSIAVYISTMQDGRFKYTEIK